MTTLDWPAVLGRLTNGNDIGRELAAGAVSEIMAGNATDAQIAAFLAAMRTKRESADEMAGMVDAMMAAAVVVTVVSAGDYFSRFRSVFTTARKKD